MRPRADSLLFWAGAACTAGCAACPIDPPAAPAGTTLADLQQGLALVQAKESRLILLAGGEPMLRPDLPRLLATIRAHGCAAGLITTGRALIYPQWRERLRRLHLAYLRIQLFGIAADHDRVTGVAGSFAQALSGLRQWLAESSDCDTDVALSTRGRVTDNLAGEIAALREMLAGSPAQIVVSIDSDLGEHELAAVRQALEQSPVWNADAAAPLVVWEGLGAIAAPAAVTPAPLRPRFLGNQPPASCLGTRQAMVRAAAARPHGVLANSFNYLRSEVQIPFAEHSSACTAYASAPGPEAQRQLWLVEGEHMTLYASDTGDFSLDEIERVKSHLSHLYFDRAAAGVLDDFTEGMRRVEPDEACAACEHRSGCAWRYLVVEGPPYAREEEWIANHISGLRGRVLDVGCGEQLYRAQIGELLDAGVIEYTGLDPDQISLTHARAALPRGRYHLGGIEEFHDAPNSYDHILCLRSLNHVADVDEALARMQILLKPGGTLLIVECTPFAMLREAAQVAAADRAPRAGHQHLRNLASAEVVPFARRRSLSVLAHFPATRQSSNEWILLLARGGGADSGQA